MNKAAAIVGGVAGALGLGFLISRVLAKPLVKVQLTANPVKTVVLVDDMIEVTTPKTIMLKPGKHKFAAVQKTPNLNVTYGFNCWTINGLAVGYLPTAIIDVRQPCRIVAQFVMIESGVYPIMPAIM